jgi:hypothetical protein
MVTVYFESKTHAEIAAVFETEEEYIAELPQLEKKAAECNMWVTESIDD